VPDLPPFLRNHRRAPKPLTRRTGALPDRLRALYAEWDSHHWDPDWIASPRGRWVDFQLDWAERRADRWTH
jgi:hypothetical protein